MNSPSVILFLTGSHVSQKSTQLRALNFEKKCLQKLPMFFEGGGGPYLHNSQSHHSAQNVNINIDTKVCTNKEGLCFQEIKCECGCVHIRRNRQDWVLFCVFIRHVFRGHWISISILTFDVGPKLSICMIGVETALRLKKVWQNQTSFFRAKS